MLSAGGGQGEADPTRRLCRSGSALTGTLFTRSYLGGPPQMRRAFTVPWDALRSRRDKSRAASPAARVGRPTGRRRLAWVRRVLVTAQVHWAWRDTPTTGRPEEAFGVTAAEMLLGGSCRRRSGCAMKPGQLPAHSYHNAYTSRVYIIQRL